MSDSSSPPIPSHRPRAVAPFPFREIEFARLLILRGRIQDGAFGVDDIAPRPSVAQQQAVTPSH